MGGHAGKFLRRSFKGHTTIKHTPTLERRSRAYRKRRACGGESGRGEGWRGRPGGNSHARTCAPGARKRACADAPRAPTRAASRCRRAARARAHCAQWCGPCRRETRRGPAREEMAAAEGAGGDRGGARRRGGASRSPRATHLRHVARRPRAAEHPARGKGGGRRRVARRLRRNTARARRAPARRHRRAETSLAHTKRRMPPREAHGQTPPPQNALNNTRELHGHVHCRNSCERDLCVRLG